MTTTLKGKWAELNLDTRVQSSVEIHYPYNFFPLLLRVQDPQFADILNSAEAQHHLKIIRLASSDLMQFIEREYTK